MLDKVMNELQFKIAPESKYNKNNTHIKYENIKNNDINVTFAFKTVINHKMVVRLYYKHQILNVETIRDYLTENQLREELYKIIFEGIMFSDNPEHINSIISNVNV